MSHSGAVSPGRNDPCPCGSERKYKFCCGRLASVKRERQRAVNAQRGPSQAIELAQLMALLDGGRYAELESMAQQLLEAQTPSARRPPSALLWPLLGLARARQGKDALDAFSMAVQCAPEDAASHVNLGNALARLGRLEQAATHYGRALQIDPEFAEAHNNLGELYLELGRVQEALLSSQQALRIRPDFAPAHQNLARAQVRLGRFDEALLSCRRAIEIDPRSPGAHNTLGSALAGLARFEDARASFGRALAIDPNFAQAHANLAHLLRGLGRLDEAVASYRRALKIEPNLIQAHTELATALRLQRRGEEAEECCREALRIDPSCAAALVVLAELRADAGLFIEAEALFRHASSLAPDLPEAWSGLARVRRLTSADETWLAATQALVERGTAPQGELLLRYALGKYFDDVGEYARAFSNYRRANELARRCGPPHDRAALTRTVDRIIRLHDGEWINRQREAVPRSSRPVFIVGMLRSGTTLAEQILASHPAVFGAGELTFWSEASAAMWSETPAPGASQAIPSDALLADLGRRYLGVLQGSAPDAARIVDKLPTNFLSIGLIHAALPDARIIHMLRHPIDTCLSIYFQHFEAANTYANHLEDLAHYYREYWRLMEHWRAVVPSENLLEVPYEGLVADLPTWTRRMLEFIAVPWDPRCLNFDLTPRSVVTASKWQVRQKLYGSSVGRWHHYAGFVGALMPLLELSSARPRL